jgi:hypothetical protein
MAKDNREKKSKSTSLAMKMIRWTTKSNVKTGRERKQ